MTSILLLTLLSKLHCQPEIGSVSLLPVANVVVSLVTNVLTAGHEVAIEARGAVEVSRQGPVLGAVGVEQAVPVDRLGWVAAVCWSLCSRSRHRRAGSSRRARPERRRPPAARPARGDRGAPNRNRRLLRLPVGPRSRSAILPSHLGDALAPPTRPRLPLFHADALGTHVSTGMSTPSQSPKAPERGRIP